MGNSNNDPKGGEGHDAAISALLAHPALQDPVPTSPGAAAAGHPRDTVAWAETVEDGNLRVGYVLPSSDLRVTDAGVLWPAPGPQAEALLGPDGAAGSRHRLVWVDIALP